MSSLFTNDMRMHDWIS